MNSQVDSLIWTDSRSLPHEGYLNNYQRQVYTYKNGTVDIIILFNGMESDKSVLIKFLKNTLNQKDEIFQVWMYKL